MSLFTSNSKFLAATLGGGLVLTMAASVVMRQVYDQPNWKTLAIERLDSSHRAIFIGSSRFFFGIDPREFEQPTMTLAGDYLDAQTAERIWNKYEDRMRGAKVVILEGGLSPLYYDTAALAPNVLRDFNLSVYPSILDKLSNPLGFVRELFWPLFRWRLNPTFWQRYQRILSDDVEPKGKYAGFVPSSAELAFPEEMAESKVREAKRLIAQHDPGHLDENRRSIRRLIGGLQKRGIAVVYLRMPIHQAAWDRFPEEWKDAVATEISSLRQEFPELIVWDEWQRPHMDAKEFRDPDHLNAWGAQHFSRELSDRLVDLL